jgi:hypothetical protein
MLLLSSVFASALRATVARASPPRPSENVCRPTERERGADEGAANGAESLKEIEAEPQEEEEKRVSEMGKKKELNLDLDLSASS